MYYFGTIMNPLRNPFPERVLSDKEKHSKALLAELKLELKSLKIRMNILATNSVVIINLI